MTTQTALQECLELLNESIEAMENALSTDQLRPMISSDYKKWVRLKKSIRAQLEAGAECAKALNKALDETGDEYEPQWFLSAEGYLKRHERKCPDTQRQRRKTNAELAMQIAEAVFTDGQGKKAKRVALEYPDAKGVAIKDYTCGWGLEPLADRIERVLDAQR
ncbi:unnamed protein product [Sphagnum compactum]